MDNAIKEQLEIFNQQMKELTGIYKSAVSNLNISENEFWIWYALINMEDELSQQDICDIWSFSKQTVNTIVSHMVKDGYATLEVVPGTRNRKNIHLTKKGKDFGEDLIIPIFNAEVRALERIPQEERSACLKALDKYIGLLKDEIKDR